MTTSAVVVPQNAADRLGTRLVRAGFDEGDDPFGRWPNPAAEANSACDPTQPQYGDGARLDGSSLEGPLDEALNPAR